MSGEKESLLRVYSAKILITPTSLTPNLTRYFDSWVRVPDAESSHTARSLARREGLLLGGSSGTAVAAALRYARRLSPDDLVVVLCADTGRNYMSKFFDDEWLARNKVSWDEPP